MQQTTTMRRARHFGGQVVLAGAMIVMAAFGALAASRTLTRHDAPSQTPALTAAAARPQARAFADEAAYVPSPAEYAALPAGETYLPLPASAPAIAQPARPVSRIFADEAAYVPSAAEYAALPAGETYLPLPASAPAIAQPARPVSRIFADEAAYVPSPAEYAALPADQGLGSPQAGPR